jgi:type IV pilus assembly protein PilM
MWNKEVILYIDDTSLRLLVTKSGRVKKWADLRLKEGLVKDAVVVEQAEVARLLKNLLQSQKVKARKVTLGFSGLHSLTRPMILPVMPKAMLAEAVVREARRVLPVPLDQLYLSWRTSPFIKDRIQVFLIATPRKTADSLVKTLRRAGLEPQRMAIKSLALTRAIPVNTAILVDAQPSEFEIIVMVDGIAQPIRTVPLQEQELTAEEKMNMITHDLERSIKFYDTNNPEKPLNAAVPVYVSGELSSDAESQKILADYSGRQVLALNPALPGMEQIDPGHYMVNLALSIRRPPLLREPTFPVASINVLPAPYQPKPMSLVRVIGIPGGAAVAALVVPMLMLLQNTSATNASLQNQLDNTNQIVNTKTVQKQQLTKSIADLQKQSAAAKRASDDIQLSLNVLNAGQEAVKGDLQLVLSLLQGTITLTSISESGDNLSIAGKCGNESNVLAYARSLDLSGRFQETTVTSIKVVPAVDGPNPVDSYIQFTLTLTRKS